MAKNIVSYMARLFLFITLNILFICFFSSPVFAGGTGMEGLAQALIIAYIFYTGLIFVLIVLLLIFRYVHVTAKAGRFNLVCRSIFDFIVITYSISLLIFVTRTISGSISYPCGYGGLLWELIAYGNNIYKPAIFLLVPLIIGVIVISNLMTFRVTGVKRTLLHFAVWLLLAIGVPSLFQPPIVTKLFVDLHRLFVFLYNPRVESSCKRHVQLPSEDWNNLLLEESLKRTEQHEKMLRKKFKKSTFWDFMPSYLKVGLSLLISFVCIRWFILRRRRFTARSRLNRHDSNKGR